MRKFKLPRFNLKSRLDKRFLKIGNCKGDVFSNSRSHHRTFNVPFRRR